MGHYEELAAKVETEAVYINADMGCLYNLNGYPIIFRHIEGKVSIIVYHSTNWKQFAFTSLAVGLEWFAKYIKLKGLKPAGRAELCTRCYGRKGTFSKYTINDGKCFKCQDRGFYIVKGDN